MPYKYIGRKTDYLGKTLWEIVGNLKNFGVGRIVVRSRFERYPEPSYLKILKVEPLVAPEKQTMDDQRKVRVVVEKTFRGKTIPKPITIESASYKTDYRLIPKDEETKYCRQLEKKNEKILPQFMEFPPVLKELLLREQQSKGDMKTEPKLEIVYQKNKYYRIARDGEKPTVEHNIALGDTPYTSLYKNIVK